MPEGIWYNCRPTPTRVEQWLDRALSHVGLPWGSRPRACNIWDGDRDCIPVLIELLNDPHPHTVCWAAVALRQMDPPAKESVTALKTAWHHWKTHLYEPADSTMFAGGGETAYVIGEALRCTDLEAAEQAGVPIK
jgi:hypothetical protein